MTAVLTPQEWAAQETEREAKTWLRDVPRALLESFDLTRHPSPASHAQVMQWKPADAGLMLSGATGKGKSRSLAQLIRRLAYDGVRVCYWSAPRLADAISASALDSVHEMDRLVRGLEYARVLALDDIGAIGQRSASPRNCIGSSTPGMPKAVPCSSRRTAPPPSFRNGFSTSTAAPFAVSGR